MISTLFQGLKFKKLRFSVFQVVHLAGDIAEISATLWPLFTKTEVAGALAYMWIMVRIGLMDSEEKSFENVDDRRRIPDYTISSPSAQVS